MRYSFQPPALQFFCSHGRQTVETAPCRLATAATERRLFLNYPLRLQALVLLQRGVIQAGLDNLVAQAAEVVDLEVA